MYGLWRLRGVNPSDIYRLSVDWSPLVLVFGRDFIAADLFGFGGYPDQVGQAYGEDTNNSNRLEPLEVNRDYLDPDVVYFPLLDQWRVYVHRNEELVYYDASDARMCADAFDAWGTGRDWLVDEIVERTTAATRLGSGA